MRASIRRSYQKKRTKEIVENQTPQKNENFNQRKIYTHHKTNSIDNPFFSRPKIDIDESKNPETKLDNIELLQKELNDLQKETKLISNEIKEEKTYENILKKDDNNIIIDLVYQKMELNKLKDINKKKNREYLQMKNHHRDMMIRNIHSIHREIVNEIQRHSLRRFFERLAFLSRTRRENNLTDTPLLTNEQIESLPLSYYPRNDNTNEKCTICKFPFCYKDVIIELHGCNHIFHKACITRSLRERRVPLCPTCNASIF